jgi:uncharacterized protein
MLRLLLFILISTTLQVLAHYYIWRRLVKDTGLGRPWRGLATWIIVVMGLSLPLALWGARFVDSRAGGTLGWPAFVWLGLLMLLLVGLLFVDVMRVAGWSAARSVRRVRRVRRMRRMRKNTDTANMAARANPGPAAESEATPAVDLGRRQFMARVAGGTVATAAMGAVGTGMYQVLKTHAIVEVPVTLARLPASLDRFSIVQITDLHVGLTVGRSFVQGVVDRANQAEPDLIVLTGDMVDGDVASLAHAIAPLGELSASHGVYFVTGNHEYYVGVEPWLDEFTRLGARVLRNERVSIGKGRDSFDLAGIDDHDAAQFGRGHGADLDRALAGRDPDRELVLLAHQPRQVRDATRHGVGLQLSGHTHGGQIWPWHYLVMAQQGGLLAGLSRHQDTQLYVSRGAGYWGPPVRVGAPAEITKVVLRAVRET